MTATNGGAALVESLRREGVRHVFGVIGTAMLDVYDALYDSDIRYIGVRHEQNAGHMADGYARVAHRPGVVLIGQPGPGTTNAVSGVAEAHLAYSPMVVIAGATTTAQVDRDTFQEIDQQTLFAGITKRTITVPTADRIAEYVHEAFHLSLTGRRGPVVVNVPGDILGHAVPDDGPARPRVVPAGPAPAPGAVERAAALLNGAARPVILAGAGVVWAGASADLVALAERADVPVLASGGHGDVMPNDHPLYMGQAGPRGNDLATELLRTADVVIAIGTRLGYNTTLFQAASVAGDARIAQVDIAPEAVGRHFPVEVGLVADAREVLLALAPLVKPRESSGAWAADARRRRAALVADRAALADRPAGAMPTMTAVAAAQRALPRDAIVCADTGTCSLPVIDGVATYTAPGLLTPLDFGLVGFSYPAALGAKVASPDRPVLSFTGDGAFSLAMIELATAMEAGIATVTVILNNRCWGAEKAYQRDFFSSRFLGSDLRNPDFAAVAHAYGARGFQTDSPEELTTLVADGFASGQPTVIEVDIDQSTMTSLRRDFFPHRM